MYKHKIHRKLYASILKEKQFLNKKEYLTTEKRQNEKQFQTIMKYMTQSPTGHVKTDNQ